MKSKLLQNRRVIIRGAGELGSAVACVLHRCGFSVILTELPQPLAIRRPVTFSDAMLTGESAVEGITGIRAIPDQVDEILQKEEAIAVLEDGYIRRILSRKDILVDARMLKKAVPDMRKDAFLVIGLGPGFTVGENCHAVIETHRGHDLGRVIRLGSPQADTGVPGEIGGESGKRVIRAPADGVVTWQVDFGQIVKQGQVIGIVNGAEIITPIGGMVRGLISPKVAVSKGMKIADVDPRGETVDYQKISDKALCIGRGVLEVILVLYDHEGHEEHEEN